MLHWFFFSCRFCIFLSFPHFILAQLLLQLAIKATLFLLSALFTRTRLTCPGSRLRPPRRPPRPPLSQILVASAQYQGLGRRLHVTCPVKDHQEKKGLLGFYHTECTSRWR